MPGRCERTARLRVLGGFVGRAEGVPGLLGGLRDERADEARAHIAVVRGGRTGKVAWIPGGGCARVRRGAGSAGDVPGCGE